MKKNGSITNAQYQSLFNVSKPKTTNDFQYLINEDFLERHKR